MWKGVLGGVLTVAAILGAFWWFNRAPEVTRQLEVR
jgi:hypothetical protein